MRRRTRRERQADPSKEVATGTWRAAGGNPLPERADSASNRVIP